MFIFNIKSSKRYILQEKKNGMPNANSLPLNFQLGIIVSIDERGGENSEFCLELA